MLNRRVWEALRSRGHRTRNARSLPGLVIGNLLLQWMGGRFYVFLDTMHALTVILGLRLHPLRQAVPHLPAAGQLGVAYCKREGAEGAPHRWARCHQPFASARQVTDLKEVLPGVGFDYSLPGGGNYQDNCPLCRRRLVTLAQSRAMGGFGYRRPRVLPALPPGRRLTHLLGRPDP